MSLTNIGRRRLAKTGRSSVGPYSFAERGAKICVTEKVTKIDRGVQAATGDEEVFIWLENDQPAQFAALLKEHIAYFKDQGVMITGDGVSKEVDFPSYSLKITEYPATDENKPTVLRYVSAVPKADGQRHLLVSDWASPNADKRYDAETNEIMNSLAAS